MSLFALFRIHKKLQYLLHSLLLTCSAEWSGHHYYVLNVLKPTSDLAWGEKYIKSKVVDKLINNPNIVIVFGAIHKGKNSTNALHHTCMYGSRIVVQLELYLCFAIRFNCDSFNTVIVTWIASLNCLPFRSHANFDAIFPHWSDA